MEETNWPDRVDPVDPYGFDGDEESETDNKDPSTFFEDDIFSGSDDDDIDIDASHILGEQLSSDEDEDDSANEGRSRDEGDKDDNSNYLGFDGDQTEQDSDDGNSFSRRIDPSAHEPNRFEDRYRIKPDPYDDDDRPEPFHEANKEDPFDEQSIRSHIRGEEDNYDHVDNDYDVENPSISRRSSQNPSFSHRSLSFGFDKDDDDEFLSASFRDEGSLGEKSSKPISRGESGIEVEEIVEFDSVSKKMQEDLKRDGFDDEPKEDSHATVQTSRERRIITFLSGFVCCLITLLLIAIAVGIGVGASRRKEPDPVPTAMPTFFPTGSPTLRPTFSPSPKPTFPPTRNPTKSPTNSPTSSTMSPIDIPIGEPGAPSASPPGNEPSPTGGAPGSPDVTEPSTLSPTGPSGTSPVSQNTDLLQFLISNSLDEGEAVQTTGSPQNDAYTWLSTNAFLSIYSDEQILTRYALATFFYATNGPTTWDASIRDDGWLTDAPECEWGSTANNQCAQGVYTSLTLDFVGVSGSIPDELGLLTGLERFSVRGSGETTDTISGSIPDIFGTLSNMQTIRLNDNDLTGLIPTSFGLMTDCLVLILSGNSLIGKIPKELANTSARTLNLGDNQLSSQIPKELFSLKELQILNLQNNNLSGTIPIEIGDATNISNINFSNNQLGGSIPSEMGNLVNIRSAINLASNKLSGEIPSEIGRLNKMKNFEVQDNLLAGSVPAELSGLASIELFRIDGNSGIFGSMPDSVCNTFGSITISYSDCGLDNFECECCTYCCEGGMCECNIDDVDVCGEDLTGVRMPFL